MSRKLPLVPTIIVAAAVAVMIGLGIWQLGRRYPGQTATLTVLGALFVLMTAATNTVDARYLLPFMPLIYFAEAAGLSWIARTLLADERIGDPPA